MLTQGMALPPRFVLLIIPLVVWNERCAKITELGRLQDQLNPVCSAPGGQHTARTSNVCIYNYGDTVTQSSANAATQ